MSDIEGFKESNWRLAEAFGNELDALLDELIDIDEQCGTHIDDERRHRIGAWDRIEILARWPGGDEFLTDEDRLLLQESHKFQAQIATPNIEGTRLAALKE